MQIQPCLASLNVMHWCMIKRLTRAGYSLKPLVYSMYELSAHQQEDKRDSERQERTEEHRREIYRHRQPVEQAIISYNKFPSRHIFVMHGCVYSTYKQHKHKERGPSENSVKPFKMNTYSSSYVTVVVNPVFPLLSVLWAERSSLFLSLYFFKLFHKQQEVVRFS